MDSLQPKSHSTILLVDDVDFTRHGLRWYLTRHGFEVVEAGDAATARQVAEQTQLDAAVIDISIPPAPGMKSQTEYSYGIQLAQDLKSRTREIGVVLFSAHDDRGADVLDMVRQGVRGIAYKLKGNQPDQLLQAIQDVMAGMVVIDPEVTSVQSLAQELLTRLEADERPWVEKALSNCSELTPREGEIAHRLAAAQNTEGIAAALGITTKAVENYVTRAYEKLGLGADLSVTAPHLRKVVLLAKACMIHDLQAGNKR